MGHGIPERWIPYASVGGVIQGTRFIAFKVPLKEALCASLPCHERFTTAQLMQKIPKLRLIIDLTNTDRYYNKADFMAKKVSYEKIYCPGRVVPPQATVKRFFSIVDAFLAQNKDGDGLIGVHCTHGVNRTGYFICKYMIERLGVEPGQAISGFNAARGHEMERENFLADLRGESAPNQEAASFPGQGWRGRPHLRDHRDHREGRRRGGAAANGNVGYGDRRLRDDRPYARPHHHNHYQRQDYQPPHRQGYQPQGYRNYDDLPSSGYYGRGGGYSSRYSRGGPSGHNNHHLRFREDGGVFDDGDRTAREARTARTRAEPAAPSREPRGAKRRAPDDDGADPKGDPKGKKHKRPDGEGGRGKARTATKYPSQHEAYS